jgi:hypothetical protein
MASRSSAVRFAASGCLASINEALHDAAFSISDLRFSEPDSVAAIRLSLPGVNKDFSTCRASSRTRLQPANFLLKIYGVTTVDVDDPDGLDTHSYAGLAASDAGRLVLSSNFPGWIRFKVSVLDVSLYSIAASRRGTGLALVPA